MNLFLGRHHVQKIDLKKTFIEARDWYLMLVMSIRLTMNEHMYLVYTYGSMTHVKIFVWMHAVARVNKDCFNVVYRKGMQ